MDSEYINGDYTAESLPLKSEFRQYRILFALKSCLKCVKKLLKCVKKLLKVKALPWGERKGKSPVNT